MKRKSSIYILIFAVLIFAGCQQQGSYKKVDISNVKSDVKIVRFDKDFSAINQSNYEAETILLQNKYGQFYDDYVRVIMGFGKEGKITDTALAVKNDVINFLSNNAIRGLYDTVNKYYPNVDQVEADLNIALRYFIYYFPEKKITSAYTFISEFSYGSITYSDSVLAIGLDMYLGEQYPFYESFDIPRYIIRKLNSNFIVPNCMEVIYQLHFEKSNYNDELPLIEAMVNEGKKYYFLECMMPDAPDSLIIGYTSKQELWCRGAEKQIWQYFTGKDLLYSTNFMEQRRYTTDGPSTSGMPPEAPGKVGAWVGWQIVRKFMKDSNGKVTLKDLLTKIDAKNIISKAKYKP